jgi:hypothetical protein
MCSSITYIPQGVYKRAEKYNGHHGSIALNKWAVMLHFLIIKVRVDIFFDSFALWRLCSVRKAVTPDSISSLCTTSSEKLHEGSFVALRVAPCYRLHARSSRCENKITCDGATILYLGLRMCLPYECGFISSASLHSFNPCPQEEAKLLHRRITFDQCI